LSRKPGRPKSGEQALTRERILDVALQMVDENGVEAFSMRGLAGKLGVDPMAIYHHLPNKNAVIGGLIERLFEGFSLSFGDDAHWKDGLRAFAAAYREMARLHQPLILYLAADTEWTAEGGLKIDELLYGILQKAGLSPLQILQAADTLIDYLNGFALGERQGSLGQPGERSRFAARLDQYPPGQFPVMRAVFSSIPPEDLRAHFDTSIEIILGGIEALSANPQSTARPSARGQS
jgi:TetR/AcrR family transcriptional regulator, tetracycline repressor protein